MLAWSLFLTHGPVYNLTHSPPRHHIHLRATELLQTSTTLGKGHWLHRLKAPLQPFRSHFLSPGLERLKGAGESDCYTTESSSLIQIPVSFQPHNTDARMFTVPTLTCTNPTDRATTKPQPLSPLVVILLTKQSL